MPKSTSELLLYGLLIAGFLLFNYVMQRLSKKAQQEQAEALPPPPGDGPPEDIWGRAPAAPPATPEPAVPAQRAEAPAQPRRRTASGILFRTRKDLRHAVVLMTVLGPCRALEPHEAFPAVKGTGSSGYS